jgi:hypothetical protein
VTDPYAEGDPWQQRTQGPSLGNALITIAGADKTELGSRSVDRSYYIGMGSALLLTATISSLSMTEATSIAFGVRLGSPPLVVAGLVYFGLILGLDRWLVSDQTTGFTNEGPRKAPVAVAWFRHFVVELLKIAPRIAVAFLSSLLFANFLMLAVFDHEIQQQLGRIQQQRIAQYNQQVKAVADDIKSQANGIINGAQAAERQVQNQYNNDQKVIRQAYKTEQSNLAAAAKQGLHCTEQPTYAVETNPNTSLKYNVLTGEVEVCPPQITGITNAYNALVAKYPQTQADVDSDKNKIANRYGVPEQERKIKNANAVAQKQMKPNYPRKADGLLARMQALQLLTTKPASTCPPTPTQADLANNVACTSQYSADAAVLHFQFRLWLLFLEILPVVMKFINALLPRRGYAWAMAARDTAKGGKARVKIGRALLEEQTDLAAFVRREHARLEEEGALQEYKLRELARQERRLGLSRIRARFTAAMADSEPVRAWRSRRDHGGQGAAAPANVAPLTSSVDPLNAQASPGARVIESEDFLY